MFPPIFSFFSSPNNHQTIIFISHAFLCTPLFSYFYVFLPTLSKLFFVHIVALYLVESLCYCLVLQLAFVSLGLKLKWGLPSIEQHQAVFSSFFLDLSSDDTGFK